MNASFRWFVPVLSAYVETLPSIRPLLPFPDLPPFAVSYVNKNLKRRNFSTWSIFLYNCKSFLVPPPLHLHSQSYSIQNDVIVFGV